MYTVIAMTTVDPKDAEVAAKCGVGVGEIILSKLVDTLNDDERRALRKALEASGAKQLPRNLYFNYETQVWL